MNKLTPAQIERLHCLQEEAAEVIQIASKILRHGFDSSNPYDSSKTTNQMLLEKELGDLNYWIKELSFNNEVNFENINFYSDEKVVNAKKFTYYQEGSKA